MERPPFLHHLCVLCVSVVNRLNITGRLVRHRDGYGFVIPDQEVPGLAGDIFISPPAMADAMHGDRVQVRLGRLDERGRGEGRIHKVLERAHGKGILSRYLIFSLTFSGLGL